MCVQRRPHERGDPGTARPEEEEAVLLAALDLEQLQADAGFAEDPLDLGRICLRVRLHGQRVLGPAIGQQLVVQAVEHAQREQGDGRRGPGHRVGAGADRHPDCRDDPHRGGRRQADHAATGLHDGARAQETDAAHDLGCDAAGIRAGRLLHDRVMRDRDRDFRDERCAQADQQVRAEAGRLAARLPLQADQAAEQRSQQQPPEERPPAERFDADELHVSRSGGAVP